jgi:hypothetical protein
MTQLCISQIVCPVGLRDLSYSHQPAHIQTRAIVDRLIVSERYSVSLHYITLHGSKLSQNDCRMWNKSHIYITTEAFQKYVHTHINQIPQ